MGYNCEHWFGCRCSHRLDVRNVADRSAGPPSQVDGLELSGPQAERAPREERRAGALTGGSVRRRCGGRWGIRRWRVARSWRVSKRGRLATPCRTSPSPVRKLLGPIGLDLANRSLCPVRLPFPNGCRLRVQRGVGDLVWFTMLDLSDCASNSLARRGRRANMCGAILAGGWTSALGSDAVWPWRRVWL